MPLFEKHENEEYIGIIMPFYEKGNIFIFPFQFQEIFIRKGKIRFLQKANP